MAIVQPIKIVGGRLTAIPTTDSVQIAGLGVGIAPTDGRVVLKSHAAFTGSERNEQSFAIRTTNATPLALASFTMADNTAYWFESRIIGREATTGADAAFAIITARAQRQSGTPALVTIPALVSSLSNILMAASFALSGNDVQVLVTGLAATNIDWSCELRWQGVSGNT